MLKLDYLIELSEMEPLLFMECDVLYCLEMPKYRIHITTDSGFGIGSLMLCECHSDSLPVIGLMTADFNEIKLLQK
jgi:hypothetical protein